MNRIAKQLKKKIDAQHEKDWADGAWGGASAAPYEIKRYFSKASTVRICEEMKRVRKYWQRKVKQLGSSYVELPDEYDWRPELKPGGFSESSEPGNEECKLCLTGLWTDDGHLNCLPLALYMWALDEYYNGPNAGKVKIKKADPADEGTRIWIAPAEEGIESRLSWPKSPIGNIFAELDHFVRWDSEREQFYCVYRAVVETTPVSDYLKNENWDREPKRIEFFEKIAELQQNLLRSGVEFVKLADKNETWPYVSCVYPKEIELPV